MDLDVTMARMNITWAGQNGDLPDPVAYDTPTAQLLQMAKESIRNGDVPGIPQDVNADLTDFVVDRFPATGELPNRVFIRSKTPFGGQE